MPKTTEEPEERALSDDQILFPEREIKLTNGTRVVVEPWGLKEGALVLERLEALTPKLFSKGEQVDARTLLSRAYGEVVDLVSMTVDVPREVMEKKARDGGWTFEDLLEATDAVLEVCILRSDGRGALPFLVTLMGKMTEIVSRSTGPELARRRLSDSEKADTSPETSDNGSGSPAKTSKVRSSRRS